MNKDTLRFIWGLIMTIMCSSAAGTALDGLIHSDHYILWSIILLLQVCGVWTGIGLIAESIKK